MNLSDAQFSGRRREMIDKMFNELYEESDEKSNVLDRIRCLEENVSSLMAKVEEIERKIDKPQLVDDEYIRCLIDDSIRNHVSSDHNANGLSEVSRENLDALRYDLITQMQREFNMLLRQKVERGGLYIGFDGYDDY